MKNKKIVLYDNTSLDDNCFIKGTDVLIRIKETGEVIFKGSNKTILPGSAFTAQKHFPNLAIPNRTISYNEAMSLDNTEVINDILREQIYLFSVGTDGCGVDQHQVKYVNYNMWCKPKDLVPFRYVDSLNDNIQRDVYYGRKDMTTTNGKIAYYFKKFDSDPQWNQRYVSDKLPIEENVYESDRLDEIESFVELRMTVSKDDCREFFESTIGTNHAKINTLSLLTAVETVADNGNIYYQDVRPLTKLNFPNEPLYDLNKGLDIIYHIYY